MTSRQHLDFICETIQFDMIAVSKAKIRSITSTYSLEQNLFKVYNLIQKGEDGFASYVITQCYDQLVDLVTDDKKWLVNNIDSFKQIIDNTKLAKDAYKHWAKGDYSTYLNNYKKYNLFKDDELNYEIISPELFIDLEQSFEKNLIHAARFSGTTKVDFPTDHVIKDHIIMINSLEQFLTTVKIEDKVQVYILLKLEKELVYSYFLIVITYKENIWIIDDQAQFDNPRTKYTTRNPNRHRESNFENLSFPYYLLDEVENSRKNSKTIVKGNSKLEFLQKPIADLYPECKVFLIYLINYYLKDINSIKDKVALFGQVTDQLLLTGGTTVDPTVKNDNFEGWDDHIREVHNEVIQEANKIKGSSTALIKIDKSITKHSDYDRDWLASPSKLKNIAEWMVLDTERNDLQKTIDKIFKDGNAKENRLNFVKQLNIKIETQFDILKKYLFSADNVYMEVEGYESADPKGFSFPVKKSTKPNIERFKFDSLSRNINWDGFSILLKGNYKNSICQICNHHKSNIQFRIHIRHYKQLMFLINGSQDDLPDYFRIYRAHSYVPYHGNQILDNIHPMALLEHPSWRAYPNGIEFDFYSCKRCCNKLYKQYKIAENALIKLDGSVVEYLVSK